MRQPGKGRILMAKKKKSNITKRRRNSSVAMTERFRDYLTAHIGDECLQVSNMAGDLRSCIQYPQDHPEAKTVIPRIREQIRNHLSYISQAVEDLQSLDTGGNTV